MVQLDDQPGPLPTTELTWEFRMPCGCTCGCMVVSTTDPDEAARHIWGGAAQAKRHEEDGYTTHLRPRDEVMARIHPDTRTKCTHERTWVVPVPAGHRWAERDDSRRAHLVPDTDAKEYGRYGFYIYDVRSLCQDESSRAKTWHSLDRDYPECRRCQARARELAGAAS